MTDYTPGEEIWIKPPYSGVQRGRFLDDIGSMLQVEDAHGKVMLLPKMDVAKSRTDLKKRKTQ